MTRLAMVRAIVHDHSLRLRPGAAAGTGDKAEYPPGSGNYYCDKPIGAQLLALPGYILGYGLSKAAGAAHVVALSIGAIVATWTASALPTLVLGLVFFALTGYFTECLTARLLCTLLYCLGTLAWPYATLFFGHQAAAAAGFCALAAAYVACLDTRKPGLWTALAGALAGLAVITEVPALISYVAVAAFLGVCRGYRRLGLYIAASLPPVALQLAYNWACFGSPLRFGYEFEASPEFARPAGWVSLPRPAVAVALLLSRDKGLLVFSPYLVFAAAGLILALRRPELLTRRLALTCLGVFLAYFLYNAGHYMWWGGSCLGPRHIVPALPFLAFGLIFLPQGLSLVWRLLLTVTATWSVAVAWLGAATVSEPGPAIANSHVLEAGLSQLLSGTLDWPNLGLWLGLQGSATLVPQVVLAAALTLVLMHIAHRADTAQDAGKPTPA